MRELVASKRKWASSLTSEQAKAGFKGWHERGYLPHRDEPGLTQMVNRRRTSMFRTARRPGAQLPQSDQSIRNL